MDENQMEHFLLWSGPGEEQVILSVMSELGSTMWLHQTLESLCNFSEKK